jgi:uracil-DNA glycosylase family 4
MGTRLLTRSCSQCKSCPLRDRRPVPSETPEDCAPHLALLGEAPGQDEDYHGTPFVGGSGKLLNWALETAGIRRHLAHVFNVISCRPPDNMINSPEGSEALLFCRGGLIEELRYLREKKVRVIVALGVTAMHALGFQGSLDSYRGSLLEYKFGNWTFQVIPTYHPAHVLRNNWTRPGGGTCAAAVTWLSDFRKAREYADGQWEELKEDFILEPTVDQIEEFCREAVDKKSVVAVDIETTGLHYDYCKIVVVGLAVSSSHAMSIPLLIADSTPAYNDGDMERVRKALYSVLESCPQLYQNGFFDVPLLRRDGYSVPYNKIAHDTILLHHTIAAEAPHNLGYIVSIYGRTPYWKETFKTKTSIFEMDPLEMRRYNLRDCVVLHQVTKTMLADLKKLELERFYYEEVCPLIGPIMEMTRAGIGIDLHRVASFKRKLEKEVDHQHRRLLDLGHLPDEFSLDSGDNLRWFLFGIRPGKFDKLADLPSKKAGTKIYTELLAVQKIANVKPLYVLEHFSPGTTDSGKASADNRSLQSYRLALTNRLADVKAFVKKDGSAEEAAIEALLTWLDEYQQYASLTKLLTTYSEYKPFKDGRIHPNWKTHGTVSGRLSCSKPNMQNLPRVDEQDSSLGGRYANEIRSFFVAPAGTKLISADYVNLEAALLAYETGEPDLIAVFTQGLNLHDLNTKALFGIDETAPEWKEARNAAKVFFFGGISYGGGPREVFAQVSLKAPKLRLTYSEFVKAQDRWFALHPLYVAWKAALETELMTNRFTTTELGRGRVFLANERDILKQGLDFKIQSAGASLMNRATVRICKRIAEAGLHAKLVLQIHDELIFEATDEEVEQTAQIQKEEMEQPFMFKGEQRRILVSQAIGQNLAEIA